MKKDLKLISIITFLIISTGLLAQELKIGGQISNSQNLPIFAANIYLKKNPDKGAISDLNGKFEFHIGTNNKEDTLIISFIGYEMKNIPLSQIDFKKQLEIKLEENKTMLTEIVVNANPSLSKEFSIQKVSKLDIYLTPASSGDALKMVTTLPSSTNTSESANPELRGSASDMTRVVLNGIPIYNPIRNSQISGMGNFSLLNTEMISDLNVYASNPPLTYSNSTAGLVEVETTKQLKSNQTQLSLSLANIGLLRSQRFTDKSFVQLYSNYQFSKPYIYVNKKNIDNLDSFTSKDVGVNLHLDDSNGLSCNLYSYFIDEEYLAQKHMYTYCGDMSAKKRRNFNLLNIKYRTNKTVFTYSNGTNFSITEYKFGNIETKQRERQYYNSIDAKHFLNQSIYIQGGLSYNYNNMDFSNQFPNFYYAVSTNDPSSIFENKLKHHNLEGFFYGRWKMSSKITLGGGFRKNIPIKDQKNYLSLQSSLHYSFNNIHSILLSAGKYNGYSLPTYYNQKFSPISSKQFSLEYRIAKDNMQIGSSFYMKDERHTQYYLDIGKARNTNNRIKGVELFGEKTIKSFSLSASYTYLHIVINRDGKWYRAANKMNYLIKLSGTYSNKKYGTVGLSFFMRPGHYYTPIISSSKDNNTNVHKPVMGNYNSAQYDSYKSLDITYNKLFTNKTNNIICFISISNMLNNKNMKNNIYNIDYNSIKSSEYYQKRLFYWGIQLIF